MTDVAHVSTQPGSAVPPDDPQRTLAVARSDGPRIRHVSVAGNTYTILVTGDETAGRYSLIDMHVPPGGGPPPHRHDFEEMFTVLEGEIEFTFRGEKSVAAVGTTVNIPANAPHGFANVSGTPARMLCICTPPGQEEFFMATGIPVEERTSPPPEQSDEEKKSRRDMSLKLAPTYRTEILV